MKFKRRLAGGAAGIPALGTILNGEPIYNEVDDTLYYGKGNGAGGVATSIIPIGGQGFLNTQGYQTTNAVITATGDITGTGRTGLVMTLPVLAGLTGAAYGPFTVNAKGQVTAARAFTGTDIPAAAVGSPGAVKVGTGIAVTADGTISVLAPTTSAATGSPLSVAMLYENSAHSITASGGYWANTPYAYLGMNRDFDSSVGGTSAGLYGGGNGPVSTLFVQANNIGTHSDTAAIIALSVAKVSNANITAMNVLAVADVGLTGVHLNGLEIDMEPGAGSGTISGGFALILNAFSQAMAASAMAIGGIGGGSFLNGIEIFGTSVTGSGLSSGTGAVMTSMINTVNGTYSEAAIVLGYQHRLKFSGTDGTHFLLNTLGGYAHFVCPTNGYLFRDKTDTVDLAIMNQYSLALHVGLAVTAPVVITGATSVTGSFSVNGASGVAKGVNLSTGSLNRWQVLSTSTPETGSNAGSDFGIFRYADDGVTTLGTAAIGISRATGVLFLSNAPTHPTPSLGDNSTQSATMAAVQREIVTPNVRVVTATGAVTHLVTDHVLIVKKTTGAATAITLMASPSTGQMVLVKDGKGDGSTNNLTITAAAGTIDGAANQVISTNYGRVRLCFNGTEWNVTG